MFDRLVRRKRGKSVLRLIPVLVAVVGLAGCVVAPYPAYYGHPHRDGYYWHDRNDGWHGDRWH